MVQKIVLLMLAGGVSAALVSGCSGESPVSSSGNPDAETEDGGGSDVLDSGGAADTARDVIQPDVAEDTPSQPDVERDVPSDSVSVDTVGEDTTAELDIQDVEGSAGPALCTTDLDCPDGTCIAVAAGDVPGVCAEPCLDDADCADGSSCVLLSDSGADAERVCIVDDLCIDLDGDEFGVGPGCLGVDCNDENETVNLAADEICDGFDNDCDRDIDENSIGTGERCETGFEGPCLPGRQACVDGSLVCEPEQTPTPEVCDGIDNDCNGLEDDNVADPTVWRIDEDGDSFGGTATLAQCAPPDGYTERGGDCDDTRDNVYPGAPEQCDGLDNDCDEEIDSSPRLRPCDAVDCGPLPNPVNGRVVLASGTGYGATAVYSCTDGYTRNGAAVRTCGTDGLWAPAGAPTCDPLDCGPTPVIANANVNAPGTLTGDLATWTCRTGFNQRSGTARTAVCTGSGWEFTGVTMACDRVLCGDPNPIAFGSVATPDGDAFGASATYSCNPGYELAGEPAVTCQADGQWSPVAAVCVPLDCGSPSVVANATFSLGATTTGSIATYACREGFSQTAGTSRTRTCRADGWQWSGTPLSCERVACEPPLGTLNGTVEVPEDARFGDTATYRCLPGYSISGSATAVCQADRTWSNPAPTCVPSSCGPAGTVANASVFVVDGTTGGSAIFTCDEGYSPRAGTSDTRTCAPSGWQWTGLALVCEPNSCGEPGTPANGSVSLPGGTTVGQTATYSCNSGYQLRGAPTRTCGTDGLWTGSVPQCQLPCGDGILQSGQTCDDANTNSGDGCSATCELEPGFECVNAPSICGRPQLLQWAPNFRLSDNQTWTSPVQTLSDCTTVVRAEVTSQWNPPHTFSGDLVLSLRSPGNAPDFFIYRSRIGGSEDLVSETTVLTTNTIIGRSGNGPWEWRASDAASVDQGTISLVSVRVWCR